MTCPIYFKSCQNVSFNENLWFLKNISGSGLQNTRSTNSRSPELLVLLTWNFTSDRYWPYKATCKISSWSRDQLVFYRPVRKLPIIRHYEWSSGPINLKLSPDVYINTKNKCAKFQLSHMTGWYFTDQTGIEKILSL